MPHEADPEALTLPSPASLTGARIHSRFRPLELPRWSESDDFRRLKAAFEGLLPLRKASNGGTRSQDSVGVHRRLAPDNRSSTVPRNPRATARHRGKTRVSQSSSLVCQRQKAADRPTPAPLVIALKASRTALCRRAFSART